MRYEVMFTRIRNWSLEIFYNHLLMFTWTRKFTLQDYRESSSKMSRALTPSQRKLYNLVHVFNNSMGKSKRTTLFPSLKNVFGKTPLYWIVIHNIVLIRTVTNNWIGRRNRKGPAIQFDWEIRSYKAIRTSDDVKMQQRLTVIVNRSSCICECLWVVWCV